MPVNRRRPLINTLRENFVSKEAKSAMQIQRIYRGYWSRRLQPIRAVNNIPANEIQSKPCLSLITHDDENK
jgi:hypothetical protein